MAGTYEIWLTSDTGVRLALLDNIVRGEFGRVVNEAAPFRLILPGTFNTGLLDVDRMIQVWRAPRDGKMALFRVYFIRYWRITTVGAARSIEVGGADLNDLWRRRIVAYAAGSAQADQSDQADDMGKSVVDENMVNDASTPDAGSRNYSNLSVTGDLAAGQSIELAFAYRRLDRLLPEIAAASKVAGTEVFFDIVTSAVTSSSISLEFRSYTGQPGRDVTSWVMFDQQRGNLTHPSIEYDFRDEVNYVYGGGQGDGADREIQQVYDADLYTASTWNRCEAFVDARHTDTANAVRETARATLFENRPRRRFTGRPMDTEGTRFGRDWNWGDKVRARYENVEFDSIVRAMTIYLDDRGREHLDVRLDYED